MSEVQLSTRKYGSSLRLGRQISDSKAAASCCASSSSAGPGGLSDSGSGSGSGSVGQELWFDGLRCSGLCSGLRSGGLGSRGLGSHGLCSHELCARKLSGPERGLGAKSLGVLERFQPQNRAAAEQKSGYWPKRYPQDLSAPRWGRGRGLTSFFHSDPSPKAQLVGLGARSVSLELPI